MPLTLTAPGPLLNTPGVLPINIPGGPQITPAPATPPPSGGPAPIPNVNGFLLAMVASYASSQFNANAMTQTQLQLQERLERLGTRVGKSTQEMIECPFDVYDASKFGCGCHEVDPNEAFPGEEDGAFTDYMAATEALVEAEDDLRRSLFFLMQIQDNPCTRVITELKRQRRKSHEFVQDIFRKNLLCPPATETGRTRVRRRRRVCVQFTDAGTTTETSERKCQLCAKSYAEQMKGQVISDSLRMLGQLALAMSVNCFPQDVMVAYVDAACDRGAKMIEMCQLADCGRECARYEWVDDVVSAR